MTDAADAERIVSEVLNGGDWEPGLPSRSGLATTVMMRAITARGKPIPEDEIDGWDRSILRALLALAPDSFPRRVVLEQEGPDAPVVVRLLEYDRRYGCPCAECVPVGPYRLSDVLPEV